LANVGVFDLAVDLAVVFAFDFAVVFQGVILSEAKDPSARPIRQKGLQRLFNHQPPK
jgi:hypothetical protein